MAEASGRRWLTAAIGVAVGGMLLFAITRSLDWGEVGRTLGSSRPALLLPIGLLLAIHYALKGLRWHALLARKVDVGRPLAIRLTMVGFLMNNVVPFRLGELGRPYLLSANHPRAPLPFAVATVFGDKLFDLAAVILCLLVASLALELPPEAAGGILLLSAVCVTAGGAAVVAARWRPGRLFDGPLGGILSSFADGLATVSSPRVAALALGYTVVSFALLAGAMLLTLAMLGLPADPLACVFVLGMIGIGFMIPAAPTNAGNYHYFAAQALVLSGLAGEEPAFAFALVAHGAQVAVVTLLGLLSLIGLDWRPSRLRSR
jgi:glycosyltransferase 2 family protein